MSMISLKAFLDKAETRGGGFWKIGNYVVMYTDRRITLEHNHERIGLKGDWEADKAYVLAHISGDTLGESYKAE